MLRIESTPWLNQLRTRWMIAGWIQILAISIAFSSIAISAIFYFSGYFSWTVLLIWPVVLAGLLTLKPVWKTSLTDISRYADQFFPELEESTGLLLVPNEKLSGLQKLQKDKIAKLSADLPKPKEPVQKIGMALLICVLGLTVGFVLLKLPRLSSLQKIQTSSPIAYPTVEENVPAEISEFAVAIRPPAYTGRPERTQKQFALKVENGSTVNWIFETQGPVTRINLLFNDRENVTLKPLNAAKTKWAYSRKLQQPGFYQLSINGKKSDLYQIELIQDLPVVIKITEPKPRTTVDVGQPLRIDLKASLTDDYGIKDAYISATMASGKGEGVSFTEKKIPFSNPFNNSKQLALHKTLDLKSLGMKPGDELYFFVSATDNHGQSSRSDVYFVSIVDTTELMSMAGMTNGVNLVPEYFRSQRQIIIDTEKLLKEQAELQAVAFKNRSNNLGIDQKLLRLRYGQFLGEENETEIGGDHEHDEGHEKQENHEEKFGDVSAIVDKYSHKHDIAEDATFFEPEMKAQLKAVLTEMWNSELRLRTYKPQEALPYEYKALRLLKDLQQKSRAYVAKTTIKTASLKPEKRLTGELKDITQPVQKMNYEQKEVRMQNLKTAISVLENRKLGQKLNTIDLLSLQETEKYMIGAAADHPNTYLPALTGLRKIVASKSVLQKEIGITEKALEKMIGIEPLKPVSAKAGPGNSLYRNYFKNLNRMGR